MNSLGSYLIGSFLSDFKVSNAKFSVALYTSTSRVDSLIWIIKVIDMIGRTTELLEWHIKVRRYSDAVRALVYVYIARNNTRYCIQGNQMVMELLSNYSDSFLAGLIDGDGDVEIDLDRTHRRVYARITTASTEIVNLVNLAISRLGSVKRGLGSVIGDVREKVSK